MFCFPSYGWSNEEIVIKAADYGAFPNDGKNDVPAILAAFEACRGKQNVSLVFEFGVYDIQGGSESESGRSQPSFDIKNIHDLTIDGNGAEFVGHEFSTMFYFTECHKRLVKNPLITAKIANKVIE
jgi:hypothetical protein